MTIRAALTRPAVKRLIALTAAYVLVLQALFGAGGQIRVLLSEAPGLCTLLGFEEPDRPNHALDACAMHCVGQTAPDLSGLAALAVLALALTGWTAARLWAARIAPRPAFAYRGRGPPR